MRRSPHSIRLTFAYEGDTIELRKASRVAMMAPEGNAPPGKPPRQHEDRVGSFVELADKEHRPLYVRWVAPFIPSSVEVPTGDERYPLRRHPNERPKGLFHLVIPELPEAEHLVLGETAVRERTAEVQRKELFSINMRELKLQGGAQ